MQKLEQLHPEAPLLPHAALWNGVGTYWHQEGAPLAPRPEPLLTGADASSEASQAQHSGSFDHDSVGVSTQKLAHAHPEALLPRHATLWKGVGTYWHHEGTLPRAPVEALLTGRDVLSEARHAQHSGLPAHEFAGLSQHKLEHAHPGVLLPRHATL